MKQWSQFSTFLLILEQYKCSINYKVYKNDVAVLVLNEPMFMFSVSIDVRILLTVFYSIFVTELYYTEVGTMEIRESTHYKNRNARFYSSKSCQDSYSNTLLLELWCIIIRSPILPNVIQFGLRLGSYN